MKEFVRKKRVYFQNPKGMTGAPGVNMTFESVPFEILGEKVLWCHQGLDRNKALKRQRQEQVNKENVSTQQHRNSFDHPTQ